MKLADDRPSLKSLGRHLSLMAKAMSLKVSVYSLKFRIWLAKLELEGFLEAIGASKERMHNACQRDAALAFERMLGETPIDSLGLQPNIVKSLQWADIHNLKELGMKLWSLQSIPNIGTMREKQIEKAYARRLERAAIESCHTFVISQEIRNHIAFRDAMHNIKANFGARLETIRAGADGYYVDSDYYCNDAGYREAAWNEKERLWADTTAFLGVMRAKLKKARAGQATVLMPIQDRTFQSMAADELSQITFTLTYGFFKCYQVKAGRIVSK
jgi:hypothetical protein